ncbi:MAG: glycosyltransferase [Clostridia bacterium]|nr:glycosyltransferase [Clostridia bacterium]
MNDYSSMISVIIPVYKVEPYLRRCVDSVIAQTYKNLEIILVDDGSPDNCGRICDEYALKDSRIKVIHQENRGQSAARNIGLDNATGDYIGFVDSDDYIEPNMYEKLYESLSINNADISICNFEQVGSLNKVILADSPITDELLTKQDAFSKLTDKRLWYYLVIWNKLYKKNIFSSLRFPEGKICEDNYIIHEVFDNAETIVSVKEILYYYFYRADSITYSPPTVKDLDSIEAFYNRIVFFEKNGYAEFAEKTRNLCLNEYIYLRKNINFTEENNKDCSKEYLKRIDQMAKSVYRKSIHSFSFKKAFFYAFPNLYLHLLKTKKKIL